MTGKYIYDQGQLSLVFDIQQITPDAKIRIELPDLHMAMEPVSVAVLNNTIEIVIENPTAPGSTNTIILIHDGESFDVRGYFIFADLTGKAIPYSGGPSKQEVMLAELPGKRSNKKVIRSKEELAQAVETLLKQMTLEEKIGQMSQGLGGDTSAIGAEINQALPLEEQIRWGMVGSLVSFAPLPLKYHQQKIAVEESRLGIPLMFCLDVIHGAQTVMPIPLGWSCSFNPALVEEACRVAAEEATAAGVNYAFAPMLDIGRDPRWGRDDTILACLKHFIGYGASEGGRDYNTCEISKTTLRNIYLPPFKAGIKAGAGSVMNAFNVINGVPMAIHKPLLRDLLRDELGFQGIVISDYAAVAESVAHGAATDLKDAAGKTVEASLDIEMATNAFHTHLPELVRCGKLPESRIDEAVRRILTTKYRLGLMDDPYLYIRPEKAETIFSERNREKSRELARESSVLLKNDGVLPLQVGAKIALIGPKGDSKDLLGPWHSSSTGEKTVTMRKGLEEAGFSVSFAEGSGIVNGIENGIEDTVKAAEGSEVILLALGEDAWMSGEAASRLDITIPEAQMELARAIVRLGKPTVLILTNGRPLLLDWFEENVNGILETWFLGSEAGHAIADLLSGACNPSGKLSITFPRHAGQIPLYYNHLSTGRPYDGKEENKFLSRYLDGPNTPLYPFGYGLSYTDFQIDGLQLSSDELTTDSSITAEVTVTNTGTCTGSETVQCYIRDIAASIARPVKELKAFQKIFLKPGESKTVCFDITEPMLRFYNAAGKELSEAGTFTIMIGNSAMDKDLLAEDFRLVVHQG